MCLDARTRRDGEGRRTTLVMADIDTGTRLVITHDWQVPKARAADEAALRAAERLAPGVRLAALAQGQLLAQQAARRPAGSVRLARARSSQNSVLPQSADWAQLGSPVRFDSVAALRAEQMDEHTPAVQHKRGRGSAQRRTRSLSRRLQGMSRSSLTSPASPTRVATLIARTIQTLPLGRLTRLSSACTWPRSRGGSTRYAWTVCPWRPARTPLSEAISPADNTETSAAYLPSS